MYVWLFVCVCVRAQMGVDVDVYACKHTLLDWGLMRRVQNLDRNPVLQYDMLCVLA